MIPTRPRTCSSGFYSHFNALIQYFCATLFQTIHQTNSHPQFFCFTCFLVLCTLYTNTNTNTTISPIAQTVYEMYTLSKNFTFWPWGYHSSPKGEITCYPSRSTILPNFIVLSRRRYPLQNICGQITNKVDWLLPTVNDIYISSMPVGMWG